MTAKGRIDNPAKTDSCEIREGGGLASSVIVLRPGRVSASWAKIETDPQIRSRKRRNLIFDMKLIVS
jgi:hypothetical protein